MKNKFAPEKIEKFKQLTKNAQSIAIISHTNPDGDAIGSGLAMLRMLKNIYPQKTIRFITPNDMSDSMRLVDTQKECETFMGDIQNCTAFLAAADLIILVDFNDTDRLDKMGVAVERNLMADKILIDHHMNPKLQDLNFHSTDSSSTAFLVLNLLENLGVKITREIGEPLYLGMMTDTGGFMFGNLSGELYRAVGVLVDGGVDPVKINQWVFNNQTQDRVQLTGYLINNKLSVFEENHSAITTLTMEEKERFNYKIGDTEGVVNIPLTIKGIVFSAFVVENRDHIKISLRSLGDLDVNEICGEHFNGGGHKNAAGGKFYGSVEQTVEKLREIISKL